MKKAYFKPLFEIQKFSFEEILDEAVVISDPETDISSDGGSGGSGDIFG